MRQVNLWKRLQDEEFEKWVEDFMFEVSQASAEDIVNVVDDFTFTGSHTERRTIDAGAATLAELRDYVVTFINDAKSRGSKANTQ